MPPEPEPASDLITFENAHLPKDTAVKEIFGMARDLAVSRHKRSHTSTSWFNTLTKMMAQMEEMPDLDPVAAGRCAAFAFALAARDMAKQPGEKPAEYGQVMFSVNQAFRRYADPEEQWSAFANTPAGEGEPPLEVRMLQALIVCYGARRLGEERAESAEISKVRGINDELAAELREDQIPAPLWRALRERLAAQAPPPKPV